MGEGGSKVVQAGKTALLGGHDRLQVGHLLLQLLHTATGGVELVAEQVVILMCPGAGKRGERGHCGKAGRVKLRIEEYEGGGRGRESKERRGKRILSRI